MADCTECGAHLEPSDRVCPQCAAPASGLTQSFRPIGSEEGVCSDAAEQVEGPVLVVRKGPQLGERFYIDQEKLTVGRDPDSDIFLNDMTVSRSHAVLMLSQGSVTVTDAGSLNGTYVNGVCVDKAELREGDILQIGTFQMMFHGEARS